SIYDLPDADYADLFRRARDLEGALRHVAGSGRVGLAVEGFGVDHAHLHLVPVDRVNDLDPCLKKAASRDALREFGDRLRAAIRDTQGHPTSARHGRRDQA
ncbi:MAG: HIT family protein, partial [Hyphomicrobiales bacterium]